MANVRYVFGIKWARGIDVYDPNPSGTLPKKMVSVDAPFITTAGDLPSLYPLLDARYAAGEVPDSIVLDIGDTPTWVQVGDRVNTYQRSTVVDDFADARVVARKVTRFNNGFAKLDPTLNTQRQLDADRLTIDLKNVATGNDGGRNAAAVSFRNTDSQIQSGQLSAPSFQTWSWTQVDEIDGQEIEVKESIILTVAKIKFSIGPTDIVSLPDDVTFFFYVNGVAETFVQVPAGESEWSVAGSFLVHAPSKMMCSIDSVGANSLGDLSGVKASLEFDTAPATLNRESTAYTP